jgi:hypothetical protein
MKQKHDNPFDDVFFWFQLAATDFFLGFNEGRCEEGAEAEKGGSKTWDPNPEKPTMRNPERAV